MLLKLLAVGLGDIRHLVDVAHLLLVYPFRHLRGRELRHAEFCCDNLQIVERHTHKYLLFCVHQNFFPILAAKLLKKFCFPTKMPYLCTYFNIIRLK